MKDETASKPEDTLVQSGERASGKWVRSMSTKKTMLAVAAIGIVTVASLPAVLDTVHVNEKDPVITEQKDPVPQNAQAQDEEDGDLARARQVQPQTESFDSIKKLVAGQSAQLNRQLDMVQAEQATMTDTLAGLAAVLSTVPESVLKLRERHDSLAQDLETMQLQLQGIYAEVQEHRTSARPADTPAQSMIRVPFNIEAIDSWDDTLYVAASQQGHFAFLREGEKRAGWEVMQIDASRGVVTLRDPAGQDHTVSVTR